MSEVTWKQEDYLAVSSASGWGRAKNARDAVKIARDNSASWIKKFKVYVYRLSDQTDQVEVQGGFESFHISHDAGEIRKVAEIPFNVSIRFIPKTYEPIAI